MYLESSFPGGGGDCECLSCRQPILRDQASTHVAFASDPLGHRGLTGRYHLACSKPFASLARVVNMNPWRR
jgi:hypothetical protein